MPSRELMATDEERLRFMEESPTSSTTHLSPRQAAINPNINPFAPLSPDHITVTLEDDVRPPKVDRPFIYYSRAKLLSIAKDYRGAPPPKLGALETWYGSPPVPKSSNQAMQDPAIASIGPASSGSHGSRRGGPPSGFGEGFGFGGGIGSATRGLSRGARQSQRRQPDGLATHPDDSRDLSKAQIRLDRPKASAEEVRTTIWGTEEQKRGGLERHVRRDDGEWRRNERSAFVASSHREYGDDGAAQPAWMNDGPEDTLDPAIVTPSGSDPLVKFAPGEDMIALHKRNMKGRDPEAAWRGEKPLVSFFAIDHVDPAPKPPPSREFNAERYLLPKKQEVEPQETTTSTTSRFQRFFSPSPATAVANAKSAAGDQVQGFSHDNRDSTRTALLMQTLKGPDSEQSESIRESPKPTFSHPEYHHSSEGPNLHRADPSASGSSQREPAGRPFAPHFRPAWSQNSYDRPEPSGGFGHQTGNAFSGPIPSYSMPRDDTASASRPRFSDVPIYGYGYQGSLDTLQRAPGFHREGPPNMPHSTENQFQTPAPPPQPSTYSSRPSNASNEPNEQAQKLLATLFAGAGRPPQR